MAKPEFSEIVSKVKTGVGDATEKLKAGTTEAAEKVKASTDEFIKNIHDKTAKKPDTVVDEKKLPKKGRLLKKEKEAKEEKPLKKEKEAKEKKPKVKLDDALRTAIAQYNDAYTTMNDNGATLYRERTLAVDRIIQIEYLVNSIANRPKDFDTEIAEIKTQREAFVGVCEFAKQELESAKKSVLGAGAGVATGAAIVSVAPTVAMWVATTFGTASTGTAISALSGAAATNAALAWLGGGALAAGGGGMAAGHAFLALAGPLGWGIAGVTLLSSIVLFSVNKLKIDKKKKDEIEAVKNNTNTALMIAAQIQELLDETVSLRDNLSQQYNSSLAYFGKDFTAISREQQIQLGVLVNNTKSLAASLSKSI